MLAMLGRALAMLGRGREAATAFIAAVEEAPKAGGTNLLHQAAEQLLACGQVDEGLERLDEMLASVRLPKIPSAACAPHLRRLRRLRLWWRGQEFDARTLALVDHDDLLEGLDEFFEHHRFLDVARKKPYPHEAYYANSGYFYFFGHYYAARILELLPVAEKVRYQARLAREVAAFAAG